jgi:hypothetical protein
MEHQLNIFAKVSPPSLGIRFLNFSDAYVYLENHTFLNTDSPAMASEGTETNAISRKQVKSHLTLDNA